MTDLGTRVTVSAYARDRDWLNQRQREISADRKARVTMADLVHELIVAIINAEEGA